MVAPDNPKPFFKEHLAAYRQRARDAGVILHVDIEDLIAHLVQTEWRLRNCPPNQTKAFADLSANASRLRDRFQDICGGAQSGLDKLILKPMSELSDEEVNWLCDLVDERAVRAVDQANPAGPDDLSGLTEFADDDAVAEDGDLTDFSVDRQRFDQALANKERYLARRR